MNPTETFSNINHELFSFTERLQSISDNEEDKYFKSGNYE